MRRIDFPKNLHRLGALALLLVIPLLASASWTEGDRTILSLGELRSQLAPGTRCELPDESPVLMPRNAELDHPKALAVALVQSGYALAGERGDMEIRLAPIPPSELAARRLRPVTPITVRAGDPGAIDRGGLIAQGRFIEPPFLVEATSEAVRINGIEVFPAGGSRLLPPRIDSAQAAAYAREDEAWEQYEQDRTFMSEAEARERFRQRVLTWPETSSARWLNDTVLELEDGEGAVRYFSFETSRSKVSEPSPTAEQDLIENLAEGLRESLAEGRTVVAGSTYLFTVDENAALLRRRLGEIKNGSESDPMKLLRIQAHLGRREAAADLLYAR